MAPKYLLMSNIIKIMLHHRAFSFAVSFIAFWDILRCRRAQILDRVIEPSRATPVKGARCESIA
jgi:hypothetical protein